MSTVVGEGKFTYEVAEGWGKLPEGWKFTQVAGIAVDSQDRVYVFNRSEHPMIIFDRDGKLSEHAGGRARSVERERALRRGARAPKPKCS